MSVPNAPDPRLPRRNSQRPTRALPPVAGPASAGRRPIPGDRPVAGRRSDADADRSISSGRPPGIELPDRGTGARAARRVGEADTRRGRKARAGQATASSLPATEAAERARQTPSPLPATEAAEAVDDVETVVPAAPAPAQVRGPAPVPRIEPPRSASRPALPGPPTTGRPAPPARPPRALGDTDGVRTWSPDSVRRATDDDVWVTRAVPPAAEAPVRRVEIPAPSEPRLPRAGARSRPGVGRARRRQVELNIVSAVLVMIVVTATAAVWLHGRPDDPTGGGGAAGARAMTGRMSGAELIRAENARPGTPEWTVPDGDVRPRGVEGFADSVSGQQGDTVRLFVSTAAEGFEAIAYRLGHYDGVGAREVWRSGTRPATDQPECRVDDDTRMVDCSSWSPSLTVLVGTGWTPGQYLFKLVPTEGSASYVPYVVRDDRRDSDVLVISDVTTLQARNTWGGHSLYGATGDGSGDGEGERATVVSFDRPLDLGWAQSGTLGDSANIGQLVESLGLDVSYATNLDQHLRPEIMRHHKVVVTGARDEHYSTEMREGLEAARDDGVNIVFLGGDAVRRRIRLEPSALGVARHQVSYRSAETDPLAELAPEKVTTDWREPPAARHERSLTGAAHECAEAGLRADMVIVAPAAWMFAGTNVTAGQRWPAAVTESFDQVAPGGSTPGNVQVLAHSPVTCDGDAGFADMSYYTAPSGAGVLDMGTLGVEPRLGPLCPAARLTAEDWTCQLRQMVGNVVSTFAEGPAGAAHPAEPNLDELA